MKLIILSLIFMIVSTIPGLSKNSQFYDSSVVSSEVNWQPSELVFQPGTQWIMKIKADGKIEVNPAVPQDKAAIEFIETVNKLMLQHGMKGVICPP